MAQNLKLETTPRTVCTLNREWRFTLGDPQQAHAETFHDDGWQEIGLPHSFNIPYFLSPDFYVGYGWYRKNIILSDDISNKRLFLEFDGVFQEAEIFLNGHLAGKHQGGYTGFSIDITPFIRVGSNLIAVRVNNLWSPILAPRAGEHTFGGGIYRDVRLVATQSVHVTWCGVALTTPQVSHDSALVQIKTEIANDSDQTTIISVQQTILDPDGIVVAQSQTSHQLSAQSVQEVSQTSAPITHPRLWHPDHPNLYSVKTSLLRDGKIVDEVQNPLGLRWFEWTADRGFFLNSEHFYLRGANVHQDHAGWSDAVTHAGFKRDVNLMKDAGFNFIRGSHYPHAPAFLDACDKAGVLFWSENAFWGIGGFQADGYWNSSAYPPDEKNQPDFESSVKQQLREMIRIHRNHPSIIAWSMCNEPFFSTASTLPRMKLFLSELVTLCHELDPTRPAAIGGSQRPLGPDRIDRVGDIAGYNGDGASIAEFQNPGVANIVSEYGSTTSNRPGLFDPGWGDLARDNGAPTYAWRSGQAIWCGMDHGSIAGTRFGTMGIVDYFRIPKRSWHWYRNTYLNVASPAWPVTGTPAALQLTADKTHAIGTDGTDDVLLTVHVIDAYGRLLSNSPPVELRVLSGPGEFPTGSSIQFDINSDIRIQDGQAAIEFRSYQAGITTICATSPGLASAEVMLEFTGPIPYATKNSAGLVRPYVRYSRPKKTEVVMTLGPNNPAFASSSASGHSAGCAVDGIADSFWMPAESDQDPIWTLDMEKFATIKEISLVFRQNSVTGFHVYISDDRLNWQTICEKTDINPEKVRTVIVPAKVSSGRFIQIRFNKSGSVCHPQLSEVLVRAIN